MRRLRRPGSPAAHFESIAVEPTCSFNLRHAHGNGYSIHLHYHPELELTLLVRGHGVRFVGDSIEEFSDGDLCLLGPDLLHTWYTGQKPQKTQAIVIQFTPAFLQGLARAYPEFRSAPELIKKAARGLSYGGRSRKGLAELMLRAARCPPDSVRRFCALLEILGVLQNDPSGRAISTFAPLSPQDDPAFWKLGQVMKALHEQMPHPPQQADMADLAGMSAAGFSRFFKRLVGRSYVDYINGWRVSLACRQLAQSALPITRIAFDCGFANLSNFNRRFRQYKRTTPREYRQRAQIVGA